MDHDHSFFSETERVYEGDPLYGQRDFRLSFIDLSDFFD